MDNETIQLFNELKPLLDKGMSLYPAARKVKGLTDTSGMGGQQWFKRLRAYAISQGYMPKKVGRNKG